MLRRTLSKVIKLLFKDFVISLKGPKIAIVL